MAFTVRGHVSIRIDDQPPIHLVGDGRWLVIDMQRLPELPTRGRRPSAGASAPSDAGRKRREMIERIDALLRRHRLSVEVRIAGNVVARIGPGAKPTLTATLLGLGPLELHGTAALKAWLGG